jgi:hypothetical protein
LELFDACVNVFPQKLFHSCSQSFFSQFLLVWKPCKTNDLAREDIQSSSQNFEPVVIVCLPDEFEVLFPVNESALANSSFPESKHCPIKAFGDSWMEVELASKLVRTHSDNILVPDFFFLEQPITLVHLSIRAD